LKIAVGAFAASVHDTFGDSLVVEVGNFLANDKIFE